MVGIAQGALNLGTRSQKSLEAAEEEVDASGFRRRGSVGEGRRRRNRRRNRRRAPVFDTEAAKDKAKNWVGEVLDKFTGALDAVRAEANEAGDAFNALKESVGDAVDSNPTTAVFKELLGLGDDFVCGDTEKVYDNEKFSEDASTQLTKREESFHLENFLGSYKITYGGSDAQLTCPDGSYPEISETVDGKPWEEACEAGVNQCGGAYDTECYGEKTAKSAAINNFLRHVFIPYFNPCCESHDRGYCYPAGSNDGESITSQWTSDDYEYAKGWHPYSAEQTPYIWNDMLGQGGEAPYNPSGGKLAVDDRFQTCMHVMCETSAEFGNDAVEPDWNAVGNDVAAKFSFLPSSFENTLKAVVKEVAQAKWQAKKKVAREWCDLRAQIAAAAVRSGGLKAYTAKQSKMLSCPTEDDGASS